MRRIIEITGYIGQLTIILVCLSTSPIICYPTVRHSLLVLLTVSPPQVTIVDNQAWRRRQL